MRPPILFAWFGLATFAGPSQATQLLHTLVSPNEQPSGHFGIGVSIVGDVDDDGHADVVVGASHEAPGTSPSYAGRAYVFSGQSAFLLFTLASPNEEANGFFGDDVSAAGDVNNDGYDDVVVGALGESPDGAPQGAGGAYVFSGQSGAVLHVLASPNQEYEGNFGISVSGGDVDNDDHADVIVGAWNEDPGAGAFDAGRAYVFSGQNGVLLHTLRSPTEQPEGHFGNSVSNAGDMDADGYGDVIVAAYQEDTDSTDAGKAYVFSGETGSLLCTLMSPNEEAHGLFGYSVSGGEDVDCDGYDDVIVGAPRENPGGSPHDAGRAYVFSGCTGGLLHTLASPNEELAGWFGSAVSLAGDVNADGHADVVVGAMCESPGTSPTEAGRAYVFSGQTGSLLSTLTSPNEETWGWFGVSVSGRGDVNGDGRADPMVGAHNEDPGASPSGAGRAYIFAVDAPMILSGSVAGGVLVLQWTAWPGAAAYWVYGEEGEPYFSPGLAPGYEHRLAVLSPLFLSWSSPNGIGDPDSNWAYLVLAVDGSEQEMSRSNPVGEHDFPTGTCSAPAGLAASADRADVPMRPFPVALSRSCPFADLGCGGLHGRAVIPDSRSPHRRFGVAVGTGRRSPVPRLAVSPTLAVLEAGPSPIRRLTHSPVQRG